MNPPGIAKYHLETLVNTMQIEYIHGEFNANGDKIYGLLFSCQ